VAAVKRQIGELDQVIFADFSHRPAEDVARGLLAVAPPGLSHVFYSDSGSTAVEVALKMALGFWRTQANPRHKIIALEHAYHGDTIGTMSAGARGVYNAAYEPLLFDVVRLPFPSGAAHETLMALEEAAKDAAALIVEPLILGAGGMLMYPPAELAELAAICRRHGVLFIADEVMTGWGRTGTLLACEQAGVVPDILCLSKGLTGGAVPLAVTLASEPIYQAHLSGDRAKMFFHSSSYTANPLACAAAVANLAIWREEPVLRGITLLAERQAQRLARIAANPQVENARQLGTITAFEIEAPTTGYLSEIGPRLLAFFRERGILLRPLGNTIYLMPPYCIDEADLDTVYSAIEEGIASLS
jgi:adenosylmethionine-8-amino-7-oxononanoate aminotransferase